MGSHDESKPDDTRTDLGSVSNDNKEVIDIEKLEGFPKEVEELLKQYTKMPEERAEKIAETVQKKIEYLQLFQEGKKIWKREKYW